jgi:hypothetical protein
LENQINDRISFKKFLGMTGSPNHLEYSLKPQRLCSRSGILLVTAKPARRFAKRGLTGDGSGHFELRGVNIVIVYAGNVWKSSGDTPQAIA